MLHFEHHHETFQAPLLPYLLYLLYKRVRCAYHDMAQELSMEHLFQPTICEYLFPLWYQPPVTKMNLVFMREPFMENGDEPL